MKIDLNGVHQQIFDKVIVARNNVYKNHPEDAPKIWYIQEHSSYDHINLMCSGVITQLWRHDGTTFENIPQGRAIIYNQTLKGIFYHDASIQFHISTEHMYVYWNMFLGPRYGEGKAYRIIVEGQNIQLQREPKLGAWVS